MFSTFFNFDTVALVTSLIAPILIEFLLTRRGHYWVNVFASFTCYLLILVLFIPVSNGVFQERDASTVYTILFCIEWIQIVFMFLWKVLFWFRKDKTGADSRFYKYRYLLLPFTLASIYLVLYILFQSHISINTGWYVFGGIFIFLSIIPNLTIIYPISGIAFILIFAIITWITYTHERKALQVPDTVNNQDNPVQKKRTKTIVWIGLALFLLVYVPSANSNVGEFVSRLKSTMKHSIPGSPRFNQLRNMVVMDDMILFSGGTYNMTVDCDCVYAMDPQTQHIQWSTELLASLPERLHRVDIPDSNDMTPHFSIAGYSSDGRIVYADAYRVYSALDRNTGDLIWQKTYNDDSSMYLYSPDTIILDSEKTIERIDAFSGKTLWTVTVPDDTLREYSIHQNLQLVVVDYGNNDTRNNKMAIDLSTGKIIWQYSYEKGYSSYGSVLVDDRYFYSVKESDNGQIQITGLDLVNGRIIFDQTMGVSEDYSGSNLAYHDHKLFIISNNYHQHMYHNSSQIICMDLETGRQLWASDKNLIIGSIVFKFARNNIILGSEADLKLMALDEDTGQKVWTSTITHPYTRLLLKDNVIVTVSRDALTGYDTGSGEQLWQYDTGFAADDIWSKVRTLVDDDGNEIESNVYIFNESGRVAALDLTTGRELWHWEAPIPATSTNHIKYDMGELTADYLTIYQRPDDNQVTVLSTDGKVLLTYK